MIEIIPSLNNKHRLFRSWVTKNTLDDQALTQLQNIMDLPFYDNDGCIMADGHSGYGMPIGCVVAFKDVVMPFGVGMDIGCGMHLISTGLSSTLFTRDFREELKEKVLDAIPVGLRHRGNFSTLSKSDIHFINSLDEIDKICKAGPSVEDMKKDIKTQIATLGGGNHFIEIQKCLENDEIYIMIHSGSRKIGAKICEKYDEMAMQLNKAYMCSIPESQKLSFLHRKSPEFDMYMADMKACLMFARLNRYLMGKLVLQCIYDMWKMEAPTRITSYDVHHNYAEEYGHSKIIHRKGATKADVGDVCIIPGSCGSYSYQCMGLGNRASLLSCSHGAGRKMSRKQSRLNLDLDHEISQMDEKDIVHCIKIQDNLDECASSYKDINEVMQNQNNLVQIIKTFVPMLSIKSNDPTKKYKGGKEVE